MADLLRLIAADCRHVLGQWTPAASATGAPTIKRGLKVRSPRQHHRDDRHAQPVQQGELEGHESARRHASPHVARCGLPGRQLRT